MKRFGVSLPREVAEAIDKISQELGVTRSEVVAEAIQEYLQARTDHSGSTHQCMGVVLALTNSSVDLGDVLHDREVVLTYTHIHVTYQCLTVAVVQGTGDKIAKFMLEISRKAQVARYVPLH
ncbi:MAG: CopG family ribbon-helix-helix protein [Pyrobaculum sp.]